MPSCHDWAEQRRTTTKLPPVVPIGGSTFMKDYGTGDGKSKAGAAAPSPEAAN